MPSASKSDLEEISYKNLRRLQQQEQASPGLMQIPPTFYEQLTSYLQNLEQKLSNENNPTKNKIYHEEIQNIRKIVQSIYELREKKIVQAALSAVRGARPDVKNFIEPEKELYEQLIAAITKTRTDLLITSKKNDQKTPAESISNQQVGPKQDSQRSDSNGTPVVRMLADVPEFVGFDLQIYSLKKDDVLALDQEISSLLVKRGVAAIVHE
ncbi:MAG: hypothetical protein QXX20_00810 [Candidatus Thermoplasmatota archaeon]